MSALAPTVSVIVPYYEDPAGLERLLSALACAKLAAARIQVVVADDGSRPSPRPPATTFDLRVVSQPRQGFRAAAARNLGASVAEGQILVFADGDMVPEPGWLPALVAGASTGGGATVVVGRRRHADLSGWSGDHVTAWLTGHVSPPTVLPEPSWLADGYRRTDDLRDHTADPEPWRYLISAAMGMPADLFAELGGFDPGFVGYGGEDWELAHRAHNCGALLRHHPEAVAWHDGPDWAGRGGRPADKLGERIALARHVPRRSTRPAGWRAGAPATCIDLPPGAHPSDPAWAACVASLFLADGPGVIVVADDTDAWHAWSGDDTRIADRPPAGLDSHRVRLALSLTVPVVVEREALDVLLQATEPDTHGRVEVADADGRPLLRGQATWERRRRARNGTSPMSAWCPAAADIGVAAVDGSDGPIDRFVSGWT